MSKKHFCILPWIHLSCKPSGTVRLCCKSQKHLIHHDDNPDKPFKLGVDSITDIWNSKYYQERRQALLRDEPLQDCQMCYDEEAAGKRSKRLMENDQYDISHIKETTKPIYLDLRLGNLCNLKCMMCNGLFSSQIAKEVEEMGIDKVLDFQAGCADAGKQITNWYESDKFWGEIEELIPTLQMVYLTGGEPTLIEGNTRFLKKCIETGYSKHINLRLNTNLTNSKDEFIDLLSEFKTVYLACSIDGVGKINDYIRYPSKWKYIEQNFDKYLKKTNKNTVNILVHPTIQIYNIFYITELFDWVKNKSNQFDRHLEIILNPLHEPSHLNIFNLNDDMKQEIENHLIEWNKTNIDKKLNQGIPSIINLMNGRCQNKKDVEDLKFFTKNLDNHRGNNWEDVIPKLKGLL